MQTGVPVRDDTVFAATAARWTDAHDARIATLGERQVTARFEARQERPRHDLRLACYQCQGGIYVDRSRTALEDRRIYKKWHRLPQTPKAFADLSCRPPLPPDERLSRPSGPSLAGARRCMTRQRRRGVSSRSANCALVSSRTRPPRVVPKADRGTAIAPPDRFTSTMVSLLPATKPMVRPSLP